MNTYGAGRIQPNGEGALVAFADALAAAAFVVPPVKGGPLFVVPADWNNANYGAVAEFDLSMWASQVSNMTNGRVVGARPRPITIANDDVETADFANNELDLTAHAYQHGDGPVRLTTTDTLPAGLELATDYWVIVVDANTIQLATSLANALNDVAVAFTDVGTGTHTIEDTAETDRLRWSSHGLLGDAGDGAHGFTQSLGLMARVKHNSNVVAYGIQATLSADGVSAEAEPIYVR